MTESSNRSSRRVTRRSRSSIMAASLPPFSPGWMPFWSRTTGLPVRCAAAGVKARSRLAMKRYSGRPSLVWPISSSRAKRDAAARRV